MAEILQHMTPHIQGTVVVVSGQTQHRMTIKSLYLLLYIICSNKDWRKQFSYEIIAFDVDI